MIASKSSASHALVAVFMSFAPTIAYAQPGPWWYQPSETFGVSLLARDGDVGVAYQLAGPDGGHPLLVAHGQPPRRFTEATSLWSYSAAAMRDDADQLLLTRTVSGSPNLVTSTYLYSDTEGFTQLSPIAGAREIEGRAMSGDGNAVVGWCDYQPGNRTSGQAFRWTPEGGTQGLGWLRDEDFLSDAYDVSRDGRTVVGTSWSFDTGAAFIWTEETGVMTQLPGYDALALCVSGDGRVVGGNVGWNGAIWRDGVLQEVPMQGAVPVFTALSDSGSVAVGETGTALEALYWSEATGCMYLEDFLRQSGVNLPQNISRMRVLDLSADGQTFCGQIAFPGSSEWIGFVARVPTPSSLGIALAAGIIAVRRRR